jgi:hypothetical protein
MGQEPKPRIKKKKKKSKQSTHKNPTLEFEEMQGQPHSRKSLCNSFPMPRFSIMPQIFDYDRENHFGDTIRCAAALDRQHPPTFFDPSGRSGRTRFSRIGV